MSPIVSREITFHFFDFEAMTVNTSYVYTLEFGLQGCKTTSEWSDHGYKMQLYLLDYTK